MDLSILALLSLIGIWVTTWLQNNTIYNTTLEVKSALAETNETVSVILTHVNSRLTAALDKVDDLKALLLVIAGNDPRVRDELEKRQP